MDSKDLKIEILEKKVEELQRSVNRINKIFLWTLIISVALIILPLIGLLFVLPSFLSMYSGIL